MSKSILYIGGFELPDNNAAAQRVLSNAKLLREIGYDVNFIGISKDISSAKLVVDGFGSHPIPYPSSTIQWVHHVLTFIDTDIILRYKPSHVILYNFPAIASLRILIFCHRHGIKVIHDTTEWESNSGWSPASLIRKLDVNLRMRYCLKKMDGIIAISRYLYNYYKSYTNTVLVPPTVDLNDRKFHRDRVLAASNNLRKLVYAGSPGLSPSKDRLDYIIEEVNNFSNIQLDIVGISKEQFLQIFGVNLKIGKNVVFHGRRTHAEAIGFVCNADFQFLIREQTLKNMAGFPTKFVESMSCCTPIIATLTSNIGDYIQDGINGLVVSEKCPLKEVLQKVVSMSVDEIVNMKKSCKTFDGFDYHRYKDDFKILF